MNIIEHFQFIGPNFDRSTAYDVTYHAPLVALSVLLAILASYVALEVANKLSKNENAANRKLWLLGGSIPMGLGIWAMHFVGMLAFELPVSLRFNMAITAFSALPAFLSSYLALDIISRKKTGAGHILIGGVLFGAGIGIMHYIGMTAMITPAAMYYRIDLFIVSIVSAVLLAVLALSIKGWLKSRMGSNDGSDTKLVAIASVVMGVAISGMHYIAEKATIYMPDPLCAVDLVGASIEDLVIATSAVSVFLGLCVVVVAEFTPKSSDDPVQINS